MSWIMLLGLSVGLAMDAFAVALAVGLTLVQVTSRHTFRIAFHFGLFQFLMPLLGWLAGIHLAGTFQNFDHWLAFGLLTILGGKMLWESWHHEDLAQRKDPTRGWMLVTLSVATSLDALAVGVTLALLDVSIWVPSVVIGLVAALLSAVGILLPGLIRALDSHGRLAPLLGRWAEAAGGCVLLVIGLKILLTHLTSVPTP